MLTQPLTQLSDKDKFHLRILFVIINVVLIMKKWIISSLVAGFALIVSAITASSGNVPEPPKKDFNTAVKELPYNQKVLVETFLKRNREINNKLDVYSVLKK